jgi:hypothetical protein
VWFIQLLTSYSLKRCKLEGTGRDGEKIPEGGDMGKGDDMGEWGDVGKGEDEVPPYEFGPRS